MKSGISTNTPGMILLIAGVVVFSVVSEARTFTVLYTFTGGADGGNPRSVALVRDAAGTLYGSTEYGGDLTCTGGISPGCGTIFKLSTDGTEIVLHNFSGSPDGAHPLAGLVRGAKNNLFGTTFQGGTSPSGAGTVFKVTTTSKEAVMYSFNGSSDGANPYAGLTQDKQGNLYGTTGFGGAFGFGTVFKLDKTGKETTLYDFKGGLDGANPFAGVIQDTQGNLYGTTYAGGSLGSYGVVFKLDQAGTETVLHSFNSGTDGANPYAGLIQDAAGNLYGSTYYGGTYNFGTVFKVDRTGNQTVLHSFSGADGANPYYGSLLMDNNGNVYGTASTGGDFNVGIVFKLDKTGKETVLHVFHGMDGANPLGGLIRDANGNLYGTTYYGGTSNFGTVFRITP